MNNNDLDFSYICNELNKVQNQLKESSLRYHDKNSKMIQIFTELKHVLNNDRTKRKIMDI
jgi:flagellin-specific chaperone FliS